MTNGHPTGVMGSSSLSSDQPRARRRRAMYKPNAGKALRAGVIVPGSGTTEVGVADAVPPIDEWNESMPLLTIVAEGLTSANPKLSRPS